MLNIRRTTTKLLTLIFLMASIVTACRSNIHSCYIAKNNYRQYFEQITEYVDRVGKKLLIVSENTDINDLNINFIFKNTHKLLLDINFQHNSILISKGLLENLQDEAELAAILAFSIVVLEQKHFNNTQDTDQQIINYIYKAGYDPMAFVNLQEEYLVNKNNPYNWLKLVFSDDLNKNNVNINKNFALLLTKGADRAKERYFSQMKTILKKLD